MITAITCTGDRPLAFKLCQRWMDRQICQPDQWIVVDDGKEPMPSIINTLRSGKLSYIRRENQGDGQNSLAQNILAAIPAIEGDIIMFIEDDDYYRSDFIEWNYEHLAAYALFGQSHAIYYNIKHQWWLQHQNNQHASLCQTVMKSSVLPLLTEICLDHPKFIDLDIWKACKNKQLIYDKIPHCVGMKGIPGRVGIGMGHNEFAGRRDQGYTKFFKLLGTDGLVYFRELGIAPEPLSIPVELQAFAQDDNGDYIIPVHDPIISNRRLVQQKSGYFSLEHDNTGTQIRLGQYEKATCFIIGKGASLDNLSEEHFMARGSGPIIALNEAIHKVNKLKLPLPQYALQQDYILGEICYNHNGAMILSGDKMETLYLYHSNRIVLREHTVQPSICLAVDIAIQWGCNRIVFLCCDAHAKGITTLAKGIGYSSSKYGDPNRYLEQTKELLMKLNALNREWITPA